MKNDREILENPEHQFKILSDEISVLSGKMTELKNMFIFKQSVSSFDSHLTLVPTIDNLPHSEHNHAWQVQLNFWRIHRSTNKDNLDSAHE